VIWAVPDRRWTTHALAAPLRPTAQRLTENDLAALGSLGIVTVIDLRTDLEADTQGRFPRTSTA